MSAAEIDAYLAGVPEPARTTLEALRASILAVVPGADQGISYAMPAFRVRGKVVAGFAAFTNHVAYLPHSGGVLGALDDRLEGYERTKSSLHLPLDQPPSDELVAALVAARLAEIGEA